ncbi:MAG: twin-arginine translocase subunit TatB [Proteobacteria bacterium]|nr:twin-arginine translocase subunit TatB [Pseudomonadota bacterium]
MFDIGFSEIVVIGVVALVVIGPERLPKATRTLGVLYGRLRRYVNDVQADISREMELSELKKLQQEVKTAATDLQTSVQNAVASVEAGARDLSSEFEKTASEANAALSDTPPPPDVFEGAHAQPGQEPAPTDAWAHGEAVPREGAPNHAAPAVAAVAPATTEPDLFAPQPEPPRQAALPGFDKI